MIKKYFYSKEDIAKIIVQKHLLSKETVTLVHFQVTPASQDGPYFSSDNVEVIVTIDDSRATANG